MVLPWFYSQAHLERTRAIFSTIIRIVRACKSLFMIRVWSRLIAKASFSSLALTIVLLSPRLLVKRYQNLIRIAKIYQILNRYINEKTLIIKFILVLIMTLLNFLLRFFLIGSNLQIIHIDNRIVLTFAINRRL